MLKDRFKYLANKYHYSEKHYQAKVRFIETYCTHTEGPKVGEPLLLAKFHKEDILKPMFGLFTDDSCRKRLINEVYIQMPKGNAKTTLLAAIQIAVLFNDGEKNAHIYNTAGDDVQAGILFDAAKTMIRQSPRLSSIVNGKMFRAKIHYDTVGSNSFIQKLTSKSETKHGFKPSFVSYDELHGASKRDLYDTLQQGLGKRTSPIFCSISTPGTNKFSICYQLFDYTNKLNKGVMQDDHFWGVIYGTDKNIFKIDDKNKVNKIIKDANPLYDYSEPLRDDLARELIKAKNDHTRENTFNRLRLGAWTEAVTRAWTTGAWMSCKKELDIEDFKGEEAYLGISFRNTEDITSLAIYFPQQSTAFLKFWVPEDPANQMEKMFSIPFKRWQSLGLITFIEGDLMEAEPVKAQIIEWQGMFNIKALGYEKEFELTLGSIASDINFEYRKSSSKDYKLSPAIKELKALINSSNFKHDGGEVLTWMQDNVELKINESEQSKYLLYEKKIGGLIAITLALFECQMDRANPTEYNFLPAYDVEI